MTDLVRAAFGKAETVAAAKGLLELAKSGRLQSVAVRIYLADGTCKDMVLGGTKEDQAEVTASLQRMLQGH